jgi:hypothetical protein
VGTTGGIVRVIHNDRRWIAKEMLGTGVMEKVRGLVEEGGIDGRVGAGVGEAERAGATYTQEKCREE